jgi:hypothetical protein
MLLLIEVYHAVKRPMIRIKVDNITNGRFNAVWTSNKNPLAVLIPAGKTISKVCAEMRGKVAHSHIP